MSWSERKTSVARGDFMKRMEKKGVCLAAPAVLGFLIFYVLPMGVTLWQSVSYGGIFVGLENYRITFENHMFRLAVGNTLRFLGVALPLILVIALGLALLLAEKFPGNRFFRLILLYPMLVPVAATVMVVQIFLGTRGVLNTFLIQWGFSRQDWIYSSWAFLILVLLYLWKNIGYAVILLLAGLAMIPREYMEMARMDGAGRWKCLYYIRLPLLGPMILFTALISLLNAFKCFREAILIGGNYPHESIYMLQHYMTNNFNNMNYMEISVTSTFIFLVIFIAACILGRSFFAGKGGKRESENKKKSAHLR